MKERERGRVRRGERTMAEGEREREGVCKSVIYIIGIYRTRQRDSSGDIGEDGGKRCRAVTMWL